MEDYVQLHDAGCPSAVPEIPVGGKGCTCVVLSAEEMELRAGFDEGPH